MITLRETIERTIPQQAEFIIRRFKASLPKIIETLPTETQRGHVIRQIERMAEKPAGLYVMADYVNFKGEGISLSERYKGEGWGLLQVLESMSSDSENAVADFSDAAKVVLQRRVQNASKDESCFLPGWINRIHNYHHLPE